MLDRVTIERMGAAAGESPILVALSGGGDSVALLHLLADQLGASRLRAGVVDHALRTGSADDARRAQEFARELGVEAAVLTLDWGPGGANPAQRAARQARYALLCGHARTIGARIIAAAHTADDQAETVLMRAAAGSSWRGLAGMAPLAPVPLWPEGRGLLLARPLLGARRAALRDLLAARSAAWIEDPANANPAYERVRVRAALRDLEAQGFDPMQLASTATRLRPLAEALDRDASALIVRGVRFENDRIVLDPAAWRGDVETRRRALSALVAAAAGAAREPAAEALARLERRLGEASFDGATLGGARISRGREVLVLERDRGGVEGRADGAPRLAPTLLVPGVEVVWDGRLAATASVPGIVAAVSRGAAPSFRIGGGEAPAHLVSQRWLLAERAAHALGTLLAGKRAVA